MAPIIETNPDGTYTDYETKAREASAYQSASSLLPQKLKEAINEKVDYDRGIIEQKNKAMSEYFMAPSKAREEYADIWNPFQREALVAKERALAYEPYANYVDILTQRRGSLADAIKAAGDVVTGLAGSKLTEAQLARQKWEDLVGLAKWSYEQTHKKGATSDLATTLAMLKALGIDLGGMEATTQPTEPQPTYSPMKGIGTKSPGGQWEYTKEGTWKPVAGAGGTTAGGVMLQDPQTGEIYRYDGESDPDYLEDVGKGWIPY